MNKPDLMVLQGDEFRAMERLASSWKRLQATPIVDDDYPEARHGWESDLASLVVAMANNNRFIRGNRYGLEEV